MLDALSDYIVPLSVLIPLIIGTFRYKYLGKSLKFNYYYLICSQLINIAAIIVAYHKMSNLGLLHFYTAFEFVMICLYFKFQPERVVSQRLLDILMPVFVTACLVNVLFFEKSYMHNAYTRSAEALIVIAFCLKYFSDQIRQTEVLNWSDNPYNWFNTGWLIYFASSFALFISSNLLMGKTSWLVLNILWGVHNVITLFIYQLFAVGYHKCKKTWITHTS